MNLSILDTDIPMLCRKMRPVTTLNVCAHPPPHPDRGPFFFFCHCPSGKQKRIKTHLQTQKPCKEQTTQIRDISRCLRRGPEHPRRGSPVAPRTPLMVPSTHHCFLQATRINERWLRLGCEIVGRNLSSSGLCGFFAVMHFQGGDKNSCL